MPITLSCECGKKLRVKDELAGRKVKCPGCGKVLIIPSAEENKVIPFQDEPEQKPRPAPTQKPLAAPSGPRRTGMSRETLDRYGDILTRETPGISLRDYSYWLLLLAFIPLAFTLVQEDSEDVESKLDRTLEKATADEQARIMRILMRVEDGQDVDDDEFFAVLPDGRFDGAHLPHKTWMHWLYGGLAGVGFFVLFLLLFRLGQAEPLHLIFVGLFTGTIGIILLLFFQLVAEVTQGGILVSRNIIIMILFWIAWGIGFSYRAALSADTGFFLSFIGFTFGVGLCEEVVKALPLIWHFRRKGELDGRGACLWGLASGAGFGVAEGIMYSADFYNGVQSGGIYIVRFVSCVALHAIWTGSVAMFIYKYSHFLEGDFEWYDWIPRVILLVSVPMLLHGLYDVLLKKEMGGLALVAALASFAWFAWLVETSRGAEEKPVKRRLRHA
jgi:RsiW-degrading membrane proteinase PrsW (M82 family)